jgi:MFS transporter, FHS family, L-fucose permease
MTPIPQFATLKRQSRNLFRTADDKNLFVIFALVTSLFLLWGFCNGMIDNLNKHFQNSLHINKEQSGLVQFANYLAYFFSKTSRGIGSEKNCAMSRRKPSTLTTS